MATSENYIKQVHVGEIDYDIAVAHGLTFTKGETTISWDGVSDVTIEIPTLTDLITDPIKFAGTVGADGIAKKGDTAITPEKGDLVYITADCTFANQACEAGDMAVHDGTSWHVISGENQVTVYGSQSGNNFTTLLDGTAVSVLDVEGKGLYLGIAHDLVKSNLGVAKNAETSISFDAGAVADVDSVWVALSYTEAAEATTIGSNKTIALPTTLASGAVEFSGDTSLVKPGDIASAWTAGSNGAHESSAVEFAISGNVDLSVDATGSDFVTGWTPSTDDFVKSALKSASLKVVAAADKAQDETIATNAVLTSNPVFTNDSTLFGTSISAVATGADFTIPGAVSVSEEASKPASDGIVIDVTLPTLGDDSSFTDANYASADASTGVIATIADPTVTINGGSVIASVAVSENVLIITPGTVTASASQGAVTYKKAQYKKTVFANTPSVSYGSIQTAAGQGYKLNTQAVNATLTDGAISYIGVQTADVSASDKASAYVGLSASTAAYTAALATGASGSIAAGTVITGVTDAIVPTLASVSATGSITGSVSTVLSTSNVTVGAFEDGGTSINIGTYSLVSAATELNNAVVVGKDGNAQVTGTITVASNQYVVDVYADADLSGAPAIGSTDKVSVLVPTA